MTETDGCLRVLRDALASALGFLIDLHPDEAGAHGRYLSLGRGARYVQFARFGEALRAESVGDRYLDPPHRLNDQQLLAMDRLGWNPPDDSGNWWLEWHDQPIPFADVSALVVATLVEAHGLVAADPLEIQGAPAVLLPFESAGLLDEDDGVSARENDVDEAVAELRRMGEHVSIPHAISQALAWWTAAELIRRHPDDLAVVELHPRMYDCISLCTQSDLGVPSAVGGWRIVAHLNKRGRLTLTPSESDWTQMTWAEVLLSHDRRRDVTERIEATVGLPPVRRTPSTTSSSIGPRLIAGFLARTMLIAKPWTALNGVADDDDSDPSRRDRLFDAFPEAAEACRTRRRNDPFGDPSWRYWFLVEGTDNDVHEPAQARLAIDVGAGVLFGPDGSTDLLTRYQESGRRIDALVSAVCPPAY